jgi:S-formylglutathione hydrolase FrmB
MLSQAKSRLSADKQGSAGKKFNLRKYCLIIVSIIFSVCSFSFEAFGQGTVSNVTFYSKSLKKDRAVQIYLPQGYNQQNTVKYPVIYFLHGAGENHTSYTELFGILNNLIGNKLISPVIVVKPDGSIGPWAGSYFTNSELYGNFEDYIVFDLVEFIDSAYNTFSSRENRAIMGHSMGGYGAIKLALKHPDTYCGVVSHSGPLDFNHFSDWIPKVLSENGGVPVRVFVPSDERVMTLIFYSMAGAFSPNINSSPYPVDFPLDSLGNWIDLIWNRWLLHNPVLLARNINKDTSLAIFFDCGLQDEWGLYPFSTAFADSLDKLGLVYEFQSFNGGHYNQFTQRARIAFEFLDSVMNKIVGISEELTIQPQTFYLYQNYPNPFNPSTTIEFSLPRSSFVTLKVFNLLGEEIATLLAQEFKAGSHTVNWNPSGAPSGVYFYRLSAGSFVDTKKMLLLR